MPDQAPRTGLDIVTGNFTPTKGPGKGSTPRPGGPGAIGPANYNDLVNAETLDDAPDFQRLALAIHKAEYNPSQWVSRAGARGPMQLMPTTAQGLGVVNIDDPSENVKGGVKHLRRLFEKYGRNPILTAAAYNAGEGPVDKLGRVPQYKETLGYTRRVAETLGIPWDTVGSVKSTVQNPISGVGS